MTNLIILDFPSGGNIGLDGCEWRIGRYFHGFCDLLKDGFSQGFFFDNTSKLQVYQYCPIKERLLLLKSNEIPLNINENNLISFPKSLSEISFSKLISWITYQILDEILPKDWHVTSTTSSYLDEVLPDLPTVETEPMMYLLVIELQRTWKPGAVGFEITEGFLDKSWELERIIRSECLGNIGRFLGEFQLCFIIFLFVSNVSCLEQWKRMIVLISSCCKAIVLFSDLYVYWIDILKMQLMYCSDELFYDIFQETGCLKKCLRNLGRNLSEIETPSESIEAVKTAFTQLSSVLKERFHLDIETYFKKYVHSTSLIYGLKKDELADITESDSFDDDSDDDPIDEFTDV
ncbi:hypothetical protein PCANB_000333 [Pneumocystis canis]|nr:hypothetical protein PCK1_000393 [Pneumocystis canis]KAG5437987.1 hypothetical protein PCANB_000333 [Pneumocystis canis]